MYSYRVSNCVIPASGTYDVEFVFEGFSLAREILVIR